MLTPLLSPHNYPEDYECDNGFYSNTCWKCQTVFCGHKYRRFCKVCLTKAEEFWDSLTPEEQDERRRKAAAELEKARKNDL